MENPNSALIPEPLQMENPNSVLIPEPLQTQQTSLISAPPKNQSACVKNNPNNFYKWNQFWRELESELPDDIETLPDFSEDPVLVRKLCIKGKNLKSLPQSIIARLTHLETLTIEDCEKLEELPPYLKELVSLKKLSINNSGIKFLSNCITGLTNLEGLQIEACSRFKELPANLNDLVELKYFVIRKTNITCLPESFTQLTNLRFLAITGCNGLKELPENLGDLVLLEVFYILDNANIKSLPDSITGLTKLEELNIQKCPGVEELPANLNSLVRLRLLSICHTNIKSLPNSITELQNLVYLDLSCCYSLEELPRNLDKLVDLHIEFPHRGEGLGDYMPEEEESLDEDSMTPSEREVTEATSSSDEGSNCFDNQQMQNSTSAKILGEAGKQTLEDSQPYLVQNLGLEDAVQRLGVCWSTLKRKWEEFKLHTSPLSRTKKQRHLDTKGGCKARNAPANKSLQLNLCTPTSPAHREHVKECLDSSKKHRSSHNLPPMMKAVKETRRQVCSCGGLAKCGSGARQDGSSNTLVVKAAYEEDIAKFEFPFASDFDELKGIIGKKLNLALSKFKIKYEDEEEELVLMTDNFDLELCLRLVRSSKSNIVRLAVLDV